MISIITPSYNRAAMIADAIESVLAQGFQAFEHVIVDGGSTDDTLRILGHYPHLRVIGGPDKGMYDALNKGLEAVSGEMIGFLNTDDLYAEKVFPLIARQFDDPEIMAATGRAIVFSNSDLEEFKVVDAYVPEATSLIEGLAAGGAFFNAWFFRKAAFRQIGIFNTSYKIAGDREFMLRFALSNLKYAVMDDLVYKYRMHHGSLTFDKSPEKRGLSADEHLIMTSLYLADPSLPELARKLLIRMRTLETVDMAARNLWLRNLGKFFHYSFEGLKFDPTWPMRFLYYVVTRGAALISKE